ncbi:MAG: tRNA uridine-5-carboxymethylaminomethyl(34) synthesis GTPase MnmE [Rhizomicrobium sp.]
MASVETIFALASAAGRAGVAVVRVSGPGAGPALAALSGDLPMPRAARLRTLKDRDGVIDSALVLWFPAPHSFTGEDVAEFHIHGGRATRERLFETLAELGARPAGPGEFSRRAVEHGRLDLTQAEAIADLVDAETPAQLRQALRQYDGALADLYEGWRAALIGALGRAEAAIDFSDDGVGEMEFAAARDRATQIIRAIQTHMDDGRRGEALREGLKLAIIGPPNAGKSSLINALARRDAAIVSEIPGTTRDVIELRLNLGGYLVQVADTAGLRETGDAVEAEGVRRALAQAGTSDLVLLLRDGTVPYTDYPGIAPDLLIWNKSDLPGFQKRDGISLSLKSGEGLTDLIANLTAMVAERLETKDQTPALTRPRHREALIHALESLRHALTAPDDQPELFAEDLRLALRAVGRITGRVDVEELLDAVFRDFCIGK